MINWLEKNKFISLTFTILVIIEIFYFSSLTFGGSGGGSSWIPRLYHFIIFFLLGFFILITIKGNKKFNMKFLFITLILALAYSALDEIHQLFVPSRSCGIEDFLTDSAGILSAMIISFCYRLKNKKN